MATQKIRPFLWFDGDAEAAATFYVSLFKGARILNRMPGPGPNGVMGVEFELEGRQYVAFNGGPAHKATPAFSFYVDCADQGEVDKLWAAFLADGGREDQCGWLQDRFGVSWQIIPSALPRLIMDGDREKAGRAVQAMLGMKKIDVAGLERAFAGK